jgi:hypothetical protein
MILVEAEMQPGLYGYYTSIIEREKDLGGIDEAIFTEP